MKKALGESQTLRAGCSKAEPKKFAPPQTPFPGAQDGQNLISWRWVTVPSPTDPVWWRSMHAISSYRGNRPTNTHTHTHTNKQTHRQDRLQYTAPQLDSVQCNYCRIQFCFELPRNPVSLRSRNLEANKFFKFMFVQFVSFSFFFYFYVFIVC